MELRRYETRELEPEIEMRSTVLALIRAPAPVTTIDRHRPVIVTRTAAASSSTTCLLDVQWTGGWLPGVEIVMVDAHAIGGTATTTATTMAMMARNVVLVSSAAVVIHLPE